MKTNPSNSNTRTKLYDDGLWIIESLLCEEGDLSIHLHTGSNAKDVQVVATTDWWPEKDFGGPTEKITCQAGNTWWPDFWWTDIENWWPRAIGQPLTLDPDTLCCSNF